MKGSFRRRGCVCKVKTCKCNKEKCICQVKKCTCGATWSFRIDVGINPKTGKRKQKEKGGFRTRSEAVDAAVKLYNELMNGTYVAEKNTLFKDFSSQWLKMYEASGKVRNSTIDLRRYRMKLIDEYFAHIQIKKVTKLMYQDMLDDLKRKGYARKTISSVHETGRLIFQKARELEVIASDPTAYAKVPAFRKTVEQLEGESDLPKYLEKEELIKFLHVAKGIKKREKEYVALLTLAYTGLRIGELCALKWKDIDTEEQKISITKTLYCKGKITGYSLNPPKNNIPRIIDVDQVVLDELERHKARQNILKMRKRDVYYDKDFIFTQSLKYPGYPENPWIIERHMTRVLTLAGLTTSLTPHSLRHTHTSLLAEAGVDLELIMERLGHRSDRVTREIYLHVTKTRKKEAAQLFSALMQDV